MHTGGSWQTSTAPPHDVPLLAFFVVHVPDSQTGARWHGFPSRGPHAVPLGAVLGAHSPAMHVGGRPHGSFEGAAPHAVPSSTLVCLQTPLWQVGADWHGLPEGAAPHVAPSAIDAHTLAASVLLPALSTLAWELSPPASSTVTGVPREPSPGRRVTSALPPSMSVPAGRPEMHPAASGAARSRAEASLTSSSYCTARRLQAGFGVVPSRRMRAAANAAPNPLSMLVTVIPEAHDVSIPSKAASPWNAAP